MFKIFNPDNWWVFLISRLFFFLFVVFCLTFGLSIVYTFLYKFMGFQMSFYNLTLQPPDLF